MTCGYFSVSARRNCFRPLPATQAPSVLTMSSDGNIAGISAFSASEYSTMPSSAAQFGRPTTSKPSKSGSTSAPRICAGAVGAEVGEEEAVAVGRAPCSRR